MKYIKRIIDQKLKNRENTNIGILITGVKGCGKTETAKQFAKSEFLVDDNEQTKMLLRSDPETIIKGDKPRLIDEWQLQTWIWNYIRRAVDNKAGCFILTGSATPTKDESMHSGAGRFIFLHMRPMSWHELGWSSGEITLDDVIKNKIKTSASNKITFDEKLNRLKMGGWPFLIDRTEEDKHDLLSAYVTTLCEDDLRKVDGKERNPIVAKALLMSLARNVSTYVSKETIIQDVRMYDSFISIPTFDSYYLALQRIHVMEDLPAWSTHIRSTATLRKSPKRYFVDPSLALTILNVSVAKMKDDLKFVGFVFENEVIKNLRIYAETVGGSLFYFGSSYSTHVDGVRKQKDEEIDVIMELADGNWIAFEIKFDFHTETIQKAADSLIRMMNRLDFTKIKKPLSLNIITCDGFAYKREEDGINVIPLSVLGCKNK